MDIDTIIDNFVEDLDFDQLILWANFCDVEVEYPPIDDMYPDWENELRTEIGEVMAKALNPLPNKTS